MKVLKFGGSSMADANCISHVFDIIKSSSENRLIVVSAPGISSRYKQKITDALAECYQAAESGNDYTAKFNEISSRFITLAKELGLKLNLSNLLNKLKSKLKSNADYDYIISRGEYITAIILSAYIGYEFVDATEFIRFDLLGKLNYSLTYELAEKRLKESRGAVIPGFYGLTHSGKIKTFTRGGSDITGAIIAAALKAGEYENWTDVDGFLRCDPKIVPECGVVNLMTYDELRELSYMGAYVLHPEAIFPTRLAEIPIHLMNSFNPKSKGTYIVTSIDDPKMKESVTGIAGKNGYLGISIENIMMNTEIGYICDLLLIFKKYGVNIEHLPIGIDSLTVIIDKKSVDKETLSHIILEINAQFKPNNIQLIEDLSLISIVGQNTDCEVLYKICHALAKEKINIKFINKATGEFGVIVAVEENLCSKAISAIYKEFFG